MQIEKHKYYKASSPFGCLFYRIRLSDDKYEYWTETKDRWTHWQNPKEDLKGKNLWKIKGIIEITKLEVLVALGQKAVGS